MPLMTKPGTVLMTCDPFVYAGILSSSAGNKKGVGICDTCLTSGGSVLRRCSACRMVSYCNAGCQKKGWKDGHKFECHGMKETSEMVIKLESLPRVLLRTLVKLQDGKDHFEVVKTEKGVVKRRFKDLVSHSEDIKKNKVKFELAMSIIATAKRFLELSPSKIVIPEEAELLEICGRILINGQQIIRDVHVGVAVYLAGSIFNHSCDAMATRGFEFKGTRMLLRSIKEIPQGFPIEKITVNYRGGIDLAPSQERKAHLKANYFFDCQCEKCTKGLFDKEMQSFVCSKKGCKNEIDTELLRNPCGSCGNKMTGKEVEDLHMTTSLAKSQLNSGNPLQMVILLEQKNFADGHWLMIHFSEKVFRLAIQKMDWDRTYHYGWKFLKGMKSYLDPNHEDIGSVSANVALAALQLNKIEEAEQLLNEAKAILKIANLTNSPMHKSMIMQFEEMLAMAKFQKSLNITSQVEFI